MALDKIALALAVKNAGSGGGGGGSGDGVKIRTSTVVLPVSGWTNDQTIGGAEYPYYFDVSDAALTAAYIPIASVALDSEEAALDCGLSPKCSTAAGRVRFYASAVPATAITINMAYIGK